MLYTHTKKGDSDVEDHLANVADLVLTPQYDYELENTDLKVELPVGYFCSAVHVDRPELALK